MGKPPANKIDLDFELIEKLAAIHCTMEEIASACNCSVDTLERRAADIIKKGKEAGKRSLRRMQYEGAQKGNVALLIWLGKQLLGQKDVSRVELTEIPDEAFQKEAERRLNLVKQSS